MVAHEFVVAQRAPGISRDPGVVCQLLQHRLTGRQRSLEHARDSAVKGPNSRLQQLIIDDVLRQRVAERITVAAGRDDELEAARVLERGARSRFRAGGNGYGDVKIEIVTVRDSAEVTCTARTIAQTGVEMEALTGVAIALLTIYDMCKAVDKKMEIGAVRLIKKTKV